MNVMEVVTILKENGVDFDRKISEMGAGGYASDGCQDLAECCLADIADYCKAGINQGFSAAMRDAIADLSRLCVLLCDQKADKKLKKYEQKRNEIITRVKIAKGADGMSIKGEVIKYIDTSSELIDVLKQMRVNQSETRAKMLQESKKKLALLKKHMETILDDKSKEAAKLADEVIQCLIAWRNRAVTSMITEDEIAKLDEALRRLDEWERLRTSVKGGLFSKDKSAKEDEITKYKSGQVDRIIQSRAVLTRIILFQENLQSYELDVKERYDTTADKELQRERSEQIAQMKARKQEILDKVRNGEMDKVEAMHVCKDEIDPEIAFIEREMSRTSSDMSRKARMERQHKTTYTALKRINKYIISYQNDPTMLHVLGHDINFNILDNVMRGNATPEELQYVVALADKIDFQEKKTSRSLDDTMDMLDEAEKEREEILSGGRRVSAEQAREEERKQRAKEAEDADKYFSDLAGGDKQEEAADEETEDLFEPHRSALSDDDK